MPCTDKLKCNEHQSPKLLFNLIICTPTSNDQNTRLNRPAGSNIHVKIEYIALTSSLYMYMCLCTGTFFTFTCYNVQVQLFSQIVVHKLVNTLKLIGQIKALHNYNIEATRISIFLFEGRYSSLGIPLLRPSIGGCNREVTSGSGFTNTFIHIN